MNLVGILMQIRRQIGALTGLKGRRVPLAAVEPYPPGCATRQVPEWRLGLQGRGRSVQLASFVVRCPPQADQCLDQGCFPESFPSNSETWDL